MILIFQLQRSTYNIFILTPREKHFKGFFNYYVTSQHIYSYKNILINWKPSLSQSSTNIVGLALRLAQLREQFCPVLLLPVTSHDA